MLMCLGGAVLLFWYFHRMQEGRVVEVSDPKTKSQLVAPAGKQAQPEVRLGQEAEVAAKQTQPLAPYRRVFFRWTNPDEMFGRLAFVDRGALDRPQWAGTLSCEVVHVAGGRGICLVADRGVFTRYRADIFDSSFQVTASLPLSGVPSRTRLSPDGRLGAATVFVTGHSYASVDFSTQTLLIDVMKGAILGDLEEFQVTSGRSSFQSADFNYWGVTFTPDSKRFYCTLSTAGKHYLVEGDPAEKRGKVLREGVECPSVSPDGKRVAFKKRIAGSQVKWRIHALDLTTGRETPLAETRSVDDQLEWLDAQHVMYSLPEQMDSSSPRMDVWIVAVEGGDGPKKLLSGAYSPAVERK